MSKKKIRYPRPRYRTQTFKLLILHLYIYIIIILKYNLCVYTQCIFNFTIDVWLIRYILRMDPQLIIKLIKIVLNSTEYKMN